MKRVLVLVEGFTEERFVKDVLAPHLWTKGKDAIPKVATTKRVKRGPDFKGGITDYQKVENDLRRLLGDTGATAVTSFIDYYALPSDFPGYSTRPPGPPAARVRYVEGEWAKKINHAKFRPFIMLHEFEALVFVKPTEVCRALHQPGTLPDVESIRRAFSTPEEINDDPVTAPSKRLEQLFVGYQKPFHGPLVTNRVGLAALRAECPHFNDWVTWLEGL
jgi:hypothetical protein